MHPIFERWRQCLAAAAWLTLAAAAQAHDFWLEPSSFTPKAGQALSVRFLVGERLVGESVVRPSAGFKQFSLDDGHQRLPIGGRAGADPAGVLRVTGSGVQIVTYQSLPITIELPGDKFTSYLQEEGLEAVIAKRRAAGQGESIGREMYARYAKSLLLVGGDAATGDRGDRAIGLPLELIAESNPYRLRSGDELPLRLLYQQQPLVGALVVAVSRDRPGEARSARSDSEGRVRLKLDGGGFWLVKAVHMVESSQPTLANWESLWASLTFELPP
jgi:uncharacterized GH25 family protein